MNPRDPRPIVEGWTLRSRPVRSVMEGRFVRLEPLDPNRHGAAMFDAHRDLDPEGRAWDFLPYGPFLDYPAYHTHLAAQAACGDPMFFAIVEQASGDAVGVASLMRCDPANGAIETGHLCFTPRLQRTPGGTEMIHLFGCHVFDDLGYRRFEWKCDDANASSKRAAERFGFTFEGVFRQMMVVKGRNRDTAWFSILDTEWSRCRAAFEAWLAPENFDADGRQRSGLEEIRTGLKE